jgi:hypothetical protein
MEALRQVIEENSRDLAGAVRAGAGVHASVALRFVSVAGADLIGSYDWLEADLDLEQLSAPRNVRALMGALNAQHIARELGMPVSIVWEGLRAFVPSVVRLVDDGRAVRTKPTGHASRGLATFC